jgi:preprotein translocase subunit Sec63
MVMYVKHRIMATSLLALLFCKLSHGYSSYLCVDSSFEPFKELGLVRGASQASVRAAFIKLAKQYHPDKNHGKTLDGERFKRIRRAYETLISSPPPEEAEIEAEPERHGTTGSTFDGLS